MDLQEAAVILLVAAVEIGAVQGRMDAKP